MGLFDPVSGRPSFGAIISNWREYDAPFATKLRLALRNYGLRFVNRSTCCGNHGEPGC
ncbi:MAG: hypothetical protein U0360_02835 [Dehalococcoidia bacterium]